MGTDRLYQVLPIMRELKKERREEVETVFFRMLQIGCWILSVWWNWIKMLYLSEKISQ